MNLKLQTPSEHNGQDVPIVDTNVLEKVGNHIYFYSEIERDKILALTKSIREVSRDLLTAQQSQGLPAPANLYLHVQSFGGVIFSSLSAMDEILRCPVPTVTVVDGCAASAATFLTVVGAHRQISRNAYMLIHQLSGGAWGTFSQLVDQQANQEALMKKIYEIYHQYAKVPNKKLAEILNHDLWWDAKTCLKYGLVDEVI